ncbi:FMN-dependent NADH-azoreductase [Bradyrhizobium ottawaense]
MAKILHLSCSPRPDSESSAGARVFLDGFRQARPDWDLDVVDLWRERMPEFSGPIAEAKYARMNGQAFNDTQRDSFAEAERMALRFSLADRVLISTPMWNFSIPYKLKQWFDIIVQPRADVPVRPVTGLSPTAQGPADAGDSRQWQRLRHAA